MRRITVFTFFTIILLLLTPAHAQQNKVLVINSYHTDYPWTASHNAALTNFLKGKTELIFFNMDAKRFPEHQHKERAALAMAVYKAEQPDIVVLTDDIALKALGSDISLAGTPIVYLGINNNPRNYLGKMSMATGVLERPLLKRSIVYLKDIFEKDMKKCLVLFDHGITAHAILDFTFQGKNTQTFADIRTNIQLISNFDTWKKAVLTAKNNGYDIIILGLYHTLVDENGLHVDAEDVAHWTSQNSPIPIFGFWDFSIGKGKAIGGLVLAGTPQGVEAGKLVLRIINGEDPHTIQPVTAEHGRFIFSRHELQRWGVTLPDYFNNPTEAIKFVE